MARNPSNPTTVLVLASLVVLGGGLWLGTKVRFALRAHAVQGEVSRTYPCRVGRRTGTCEDLTFRTDDGFTGTVSGVQGSAPRGARVDLLYDPADRDNAQLSGPLKFWFGPSATVALGLVFVALPARQLLDRKRRGAG